MDVSDIRVPDGWSVVAGADTGTYMSGGIALISPDNAAFIVYEQPNYHYAGGEIELLDMTVSEWIKQFASVLRRLSGKPKVGAWVDANTTFKTEIGHGLTFLMNKIPLDLRTEITREYFKHGAVHLAPWLRVLPYEIEMAHWPEHETASGKFARMKEQDHSLDWLEHILSRRPRTKRGKKEKAQTLLDKLRAESRAVHLGPTGDTHLGPL